MFLLELQLSQNKVLNSLRLGRERHNMTKREKIALQDRWQAKKCDCFILGSISQIDKFLMKLLIL
jgi:hypothetical protein